MYLYVPCVQLVLSWLSKRVACLLIGGYVLGLTTGDQRVDFLRENRC